MKLKIISIILYPKNDEFKPRFLNFKENEVNVITGYSQRGKSAIISIVDYCLGSKDCNIPIDLIRNMVDKFAIYINLDGEKIFLARDCPGNDASTTEVMYFYNISEKGENKDLRTNEWIRHADEYRQNREFIKNYLSRVAGFQNITEKDDLKSGFDAPLSFRDTSAFSFQPQGIIANSTTIFYNTDSFTHLKRLQMLFPLALGYKSYEIISKEKEIDILEKEEREKTKKYDDLKIQYENWQTDIYEHYSKAISLGLTNSDINIHSSTVHQLEYELSIICDNIKANKFIKENSSLRYSEKLQSFDNERINFLRELDSLKSNLNKLEKFDNSKNAYLSKVILETDNRLRPIEWFLKQKGTDICPFCDSKSDKAIDELLRLKDEKDKNYEVISDSKFMRYSFENEKLDIKKEINRVEKSLIILDNNIKILLDENKEYYLKYQNIYEFAGKIENILENLQKISPSSIILQELEIARRNLDEKKLELSRLKLRFDRNFSLAKVSDTIDNYVQILPIGNKEISRVKLDPENTVGIKIENSITGNINFLSKIGSGANHMCYHLATLFGLHEFFLNLPKEGKNNYIPSFLILDQPSQVYYPEDFKDIHSKDPEKQSKISEDIKNTTLIFKASSEFLKRTGFEAQLIILEHAPSSTWENVEHIHLVAEWRGSNTDDSEFDALIQKEWLA